MSSKKKSSKPTPTMGPSYPLQVVWMNPGDGYQHGLDVSICPEFGCLILGSIDDERVQHHIQHAHKQPSGLLSEIGIQRMERQGIPMAQGQTVGIRQGYRVQ